METEPNTPAEAPEEPEEEPVAPEPATPKATDSERKWERRSKANFKEIESLKAQLAERDAANQTEHEKALTAMRETTAAEVRAEAEKERRNDRLENSTLRLAALGLKIGSGDDVKTVKFADPDAAVDALELKVRRGDIDLEDLFDADGKIQPAAHAAELARILEARPYLAAGSGAAPPRRPGSIDAGKGSGSKGLEDLSPAEHFARLHK